MLAVAEIRQVQGNVRYYADAKTPSDVSARTADGTNNRQLEAEASTAHLDFQRRWKLLNEQIQGILPDVHATRNFVDKAKHVAQQIHAMMADAQLQEQAKHIASHLETMMADAEVQDQAESIAKQLNKMRDPDLKDQAILFAQRMKDAVADGSWKLSGAGSIQEQAKLLARHVERRTADPSFQHHVNLLAKQMETMLASRSLQAVAKQLQAMLANPSLQEHATLITEQMEALKADLSCEHEYLTHPQPKTVGTPSRQKSMDKLVDKLFNRALKAPPRRRADVDDTALGKSGHLARPQPGALKRHRICWPELRGAHFSAARAPATRLNAVATDQNRLETKVSSKVTGSLSRWSRGIRTLSGSLPKAQRVQAPQRVRASKGEEEAAVVRGTDFSSLALPVGSAFVFCAGVFATKGSTSGEEWLAGYLLEQSLSVDNLFVFVLVFNYFQVAPGEPQEKILKYGILGAAVLRALCVLAGSELLENFQPIILAFAALLIYSSYKILAGGDEDEDEDLSNNAIVKAAKSVITVSDDFDGANFYTVTAEGIRVATPLLLALVVIEFSDIAFAVDSIPAVFGVTRDPFIIYSSNLFAILSLRSLYSFVATGMAELRFLDKAVGVILGFIGVKMVAGFGGMDISTPVSLTIVAGLLAGGVGFSLAFPEEPSEDGK
eukprot:gnl/TRDRNA2_/TRDRNA2_83741_c0_seq1.p1 gnl/TRDRNA2_/TRDRNA2_83741_c0~~gnl/TRDRNA2_/TRDRNA2_83741_c0_seq1.p1  ORF type:complete len:688 (+),score=134.12 gnl/TRDRNA2_/TRDRNA2_83741_c0_seq1:69-2066(+)